MMVASAGVLGLLLGGSIVVSEHAARVANIRRLDEVTVY
jgi:hypothetical protein